LVEAGCPSDEAAGTLRPDDGLWVNSNEADLDLSFDRLEIPGGGAASGSGTARLSAAGGGQAVVMDGSYMLPVAVVEGYRSIEGDRSGGGKRVAQDGGVQTGRRAEASAAAAGWVSDGLGALGRRLSDAAGRAGLL